MPPAVATNHKGRVPSVQRRSHETAGLPSGSRSGMRPSGPFSLVLMIPIGSVKEIAGEQNSHDEGKQKPQVKACAVQLNGQFVWVGIDLHC